MQSFYMLKKITFLSCFVIALFTGIRPDTFMHSLNVFTKSIFMFCLVVTLITGIQDTFMQ